jgi:hypothetical protein
VSRLAGVRRAAAMSRESNIEQPFIEVMR